MYDSRYNIIILGIPAVRLTQIIQQRSFNKDHSLLTTEVTTKYMSKIFDKLNGNF